MAIGDPYATLADFRIMQGVKSGQSTEMDPRRTSVLSAVSRAIERICGRQFNNMSVNGSFVGVVATSRDFVPDDLRHCRIDELFDNSDLVLLTDSGGQGDFQNTWNSQTDVEYRPHNGLEDGIPVPYNQLRACRGLYFPRYVGTPYRREAVVRLTTKNWGWATVPDPIHEATLVSANEIYKLKDAPFGVAGTTQYGTEIRIRQDSYLMGLLGGYILDAVLGG